MASRGIRVPFIADVRQFLAGTRQAERALDSIDDAIEEVGRENGIEQLERDLKDLTRQAKRTGDTIDREISGSLRGKGRAGEIGAEVGDEFSQNFGESIRGGDPLGALTETITSLGPALGAAGVALAASFGIGKALIDEANKSKERLKAAGASAFEALRDGLIEASEREQLLVDALGADDITGALKKAREVAKGLGVSVQDVIAFIATGGRQTTPELTRALAEADAELNRMKGSSGSIEGNIGAAETAALNLRDYAGTTAQAYRDGYYAVQDLDGGLNAASGKAKTLNQRAAAFEESAKNSASYWSSIERSLTRAGFAAPGQVRAERSERLPR